MKTLGRILLWVVAFFWLPIVADASSPYIIMSPKGVLKVELNTNKGELGWTVSKQGKLVYYESDISLNVNGKILGGTAAPKSVKQRRVSQVINPVAYLLG